MELEKLISEVKSHEILYNTKSSEFGDTLKKNEAWRSIGQNLNASVGCCREKWYDLLRELMDLMKSRSDLSGCERETETRKWEYESVMSFVLPYLEDLKEKTDWRAVACDDEPSAWKRSYEEARDGALYNFDIMEKIFLTSTLKEQNGFRLVCQTWYHMAHEYWRNSVFNFAEEWVKLNCYDAAIAAMAQRPLLKKIVCTIPDSDFVIECVIRFLEDVHHFEVNTITVSHVDRIVSKFKNLKSVSLSVCTPNLVEIIRLLGQCQNLENLNIPTNGRKIVRKDVLAQCYREIGDNFPSLKKLGIIYVMHVAITEALNYMLRKKYNTLTNLDLVFCKYRNGLYDALTLCTQLESLKLELDSSPYAFQLSKLNSFHDLTLIVKESHSAKVLLNTSHDPAAPYCWGNLGYFHLQLNGEDYNLGVLDLIFSTLRNLKELVLAGIDRNTSDSQFQKINNLTNLHTLVIRDCTLTESIMRAICRNECLKCLKLIRCNVTVDGLITLRSCIKLKQLVLENPQLSMDDDARSEIMSSLEHLKITWLCGD